MDKMEPENEIHNEVNGYLAATILSLFVGATFALFLAKMAGMFSLAFAVVVLTHCVSVACGIMAKNRLAVVTHRLSLQYGKYPTRLRKVFTEFEQEGAMGGGEERNLGRAEASCYAVSIVFLLGGPYTEQVIVAILLGAVAGIVLRGPKFQATFVMYEARRPRN